MKLFEPARAAGTPAFDFFPWRRGKQAPTREKDILRPKLNIDQKFLIYVIFVFFLSLLIFTLGILLYYRLDLVWYGDFSPSRYYDFLKNLFLWELLFSLSISYLFYLLYSRYLTQKQRNQEVFNILLQAISHRFGNFIAVQKLNLEALEANYSALPLTRLRDSLCILEEDYRQIIGVLENFSNFSLREEVVDLSSLIEDLAKAIHKKPAISLAVKQVSLLEIEVPLLLLKTILNLLLENAFKYAQSCVYVRLGLFKNHVYIFLANDIKRDVPKGSGMGLKIATLLVETLGWRLKYRSKSTFQVLLTGKPKVKLLS